MCEKTPHQLVATRDGASERAPARRLARLVQRTCLVGCGTLFAIPVGLVLIVLVWQWCLNRNPDPFPWRPAREWTLSKVPVAFDFVEEDGSLIALCQDYTSHGLFAPMLPGTSVVRIDVETGRILSEQALPFEATALAVSPHSDSVLIAGVPAASQDSIPRRASERRPLRRQVVRIARLRLPDWTVEAEVTEEIKHSGASWELPYSLRVAAMPSGAWVVGVADVGQGTYRVSLRDQETLSEFESQTVLLPPNAAPILGTASGPGNPSVLITTTGDRAYRWVQWETETAEVTLTETQAGPTSLQKPQRKTRSAWRNSNYLPPFCPSHLPDGVILSRCLAWTVRDSPTVSVISRETAFVASARIVWIQSSMPKPLPPIRTSLAIWNAKSGKLLAAGILQGDANTIRTLWFSNDNRFLVTGHNDGTIRLWKLPRSRRDVPGREGNAESRTPAP